MLNGIDVSRWQITDVLDKVAYDFAICKLTDGTSYAHAKDGHDKAAKVLAKGKLLGLYHFAETGSAEAEADSFAKEFAAYIGKAVPVLDYEANALANGREWVRAFVRRFRAKTGVTPWVYASASPYKTQNLIGLAKEEGFGIWAASYGSNQATGYRDAVAPFPCACYQYTSKGRLAGYDKDLDLDIFYGDAAAWAAYCKPTGTPTPAPAPSPVPSPSKRVLRRGSKGEDVKIVQGIVGVAADGMYGSKTETAVKAYQKAHGLSVDGVVGVKTWAKIDASASAPAPPSSGKSIDDIAREVIRGKWGNGDERKRKLEAAGYDYKAIRARVNAMMK